MIVLGDKNLKSNFFEPFYINNTADIAKTAPNSIVALRNFDLDILEYCLINKVASMVHIKTIKEAIYCNTLMVKYILCEQNMAQEIQKLAEDYMFDSKVIAMIQNDSELEAMAKLAIDGVLFI